jgi:hypothetical protein
VTRTTATLALVLALAGPLAALARADGTGGTEAPDGNSGLLVRPAVLLGHTISVRGTVGAPGSGVLVQRQTPEGWVTIAQTVAGDDGSFVARWRADELGRSMLRAVSDTTAASAQAASSDPTAQVTVYRPATATWYGPGFYGHRTACGVRMTRTLLGVAHRSLPCGTMVEVYYHGRTATVPVIDRGPFTRRARWDLTAATAQQLGMTVTSTIGAVRVEQDPAPSQPPS